MTFGGLKKVETTGSVVWYRACGCTVVFSLLDLGQLLV